MSLWLIINIIVALVALFCGGIVIPQILLISFRKKLFDEPDERKIHTSTVPRLGGMAFMPVVMFSLALLWGIGCYWPTLSVHELISPHINCLPFCVCAMIILYVIGIADDLIGLRYRAKFIAQILCGVLLIAGGIYIDNLHGLFGIYRLPHVLSWLLTILVTVFIINAINLIDGIDGLASGLSSVAMLVYGVVYYLAGNYIFSMFSFATLGVLMQFFYYNVFGRAENHKKIFMGDTGSLTIGLALTICSVNLSQHAPMQYLAYSNMFVLAFVPLLVPCFDVVRVYLHRVRTHNNPFLPDKNHIHHKFLAMGMSQRRALSLIVLVAFVFAALNIAFSRVVDINILFAIDILIWLFGISLINHKVKAVREAAKATGNNTHR